MNGCNASAGKVYGISGRPADADGRCRTIAAHLERLPGVRARVEVAARDAGLAGRAGPGAGAGGSAAAHSRRRQPGTRAQPPQRLSRPGTWPGETPWVRSCCRPARALPAPCCCWARSSCWSRMFTQPEIGAGHARRAAGQGHRAASALSLQRAGQQRDRRHLRPGGGGGLCQRCRARCTTTASSPAPPTRPPARRSRTCCCSAALSRPASSASRSAAWRCSPSPASPCAGKKQGPRDQGEQGNCFHLSALRNARAVLSADDFLRLGWGASLSQVESGVMFAYVVRSTGQMFVQVVRRARRMFAWEVATL